MAMISSNPSFIPPRRTPCSLNRVPRAISISSVYGTNGRASKGYPGIRVRKIWQIDPEPPSVTLLLFSLLIMKL